MPCFWGTRPREEGGFTTHAMYYMYDVSVRICKHGKVPSATYGTTRKKERNVGHMSHFCFPKKKKNNVNPSLPKWGGKYTIFNSLCSARRSCVFLCESEARANTNCYSVGKSENCTLRFFLCRSARGEKERNSDLCSWAKKKKQGKLQSRGIRVCCSAACHHLRKRKSPSPP